MAINATPAAQLAVTLTVAELRQLIREEFEVAVGRSAPIKTNKEKPYLTVKEASELSGLGTSTVRLYMRKGLLRAHKVGRRVIISVSDLNTFLSRNPTRLVS